MWIGKCVLVPLIHLSAFFYLISLFAVLFMIMNAITYRRLEGKIRDKDKTRLNSVVACRDNIQDVKDWIELRDSELEAMGPVADDLKTSLKQKEELKVLVLLV